MDSIIVNLEKLENGYGKKHRFSRPLFINGYAWTVIGVFTERS